MQYTNIYQSPIGKILLACDNKGLTGLWIDGAKYYADGLGTKYIEKETSTFNSAKKWLDIYFSGEKPDFFPPLNLIGTDFQISVWNILLKIPYGHTTTYSDIAKEIAKKNNLSEMSAQAVGGAVGHNKISIIIPCHRVVGKNGSLTGYAGGIDKKINLLTIENTDMTNLFVPSKETKIKKDENRL